MAIVGRLAKLGAGGGAGHPKTLIITSCKKVLRCIDREEELTFINFSLCLTFSKVTFLYLDRHVGHVIPMADYIVGTGFESATLNFASQNINIFKLSSEQIAW